MASHRRAARMALSLGIAGLIVLPATAAAQTAPSGGTTLPPPGSVTEPVFAPVADPPQVGTSGNPGGVTVSAASLLIEQRIAQAAIRRAAGIEAWLAAGIVTNDLAGGAFTARELANGIVTRTGPIHPVPAASPRPVQVAAASPSSGANVQATAAQLLINQRIAQAAVRRSNALQARINGGLTGGDIRADQVTLGKLRSTLYIAQAPASAVSAAASRTEVQAPQRTGAATVRVTAAQMLINQRIAQAAVRRTNALLHQLRRGLDGTSFQGASVGTDRLAAGLK